MNALYIAWRSGDAAHGAWGPVGRLEFERGIFRFCYTRGARRAGFRAFPKMENLDQVYESTTLIPLFANRLLSQSRPEYEAYLRWGGFDPNNPPDPIAILSVTEGIRQTDEFEVFPCPNPDGHGCYLNKFFLHGMRWMPSLAMQRVQRLEPNERLVLMPDPCNVADPNAVAVRTYAEPTLIGFVPRYLAVEVGGMLMQCGADAVDLVVQRVNPEAPLQHRVLCRMRGCWPDGFRPCSDVAFLPIPAEAAAHCVA